ncbi:MAG: HIT domain-containing protein [Chloroflexi bacterium]|nr:HIT domain-containing protein [Chloroflexota bacterium]
MAYAGDDFYCDEVLSGRTAVDIVLERDGIVAFHHTRPFWTVHLVVIPKQHVTSLVDPQATALLADLMDAVREVAGRVLTEHGACRVVTNLGHYQDSKHLHFHVSAGEPLR